MDRIILGVKSEKTRGKLISQSKLDLRKAIAICRADEAAGEQMKAMNPKANEEIHQMTGKPRHHTRRHDGTRGSSGPNRTSLGQPGRDKSKQMKCKFCSKVHAMKKESCPAWGKSCDACKGKNHFKNSERCPKSKRNVHGVREYGYSDTDSSSCASISTVTTADVCTIKSSEDSPVYCNMVVNKQLVKLQVDCGATVNVLPRRYVGNKEIRHEDVSLKMWNDVTMKAIGKCRVKTVNPVTGEKWKIDYVVVDQDLIPLLSRKAAEKIKLITINYDNFQSVSAVSTSLKTSEVVNEFPKVFDNKLGSLPAKNVQTQAEYETINAITFLPMREESISKIRDETERDESLQTLKAGHMTRPMFHLLLPPTTTSEMNLL